MNSNGRKNIYAIFMAGGHGSRMGESVPKQFLDLCGRPVLQQTILRFVDAIPSLKVVVALPKDHIQTWKQLCAEYSFDIPQIIAEGGITRFHSVKNALEKIPDGAIVMIHDGVRPLVGDALLQDLLEKSQECPAVIPATPVTDTLRSKDGSPDPDRSKLLAVQTPQVFHSEVIKEAYTQGYDTAFTDDASVAARYNIPLTIADGERYNIKITTPEDLRVARILFKNRSSR